MRRLPGLIVVMVMVVFAGDIHAASLLGPAGGMGEQKAGAFSVGAGHFFYDDYWKDGGGMKFQQSQTFGEGAWRPTRDTEIFARLGGTDLKIQELGFKDNYNLYSGIGGRAVFWRPDPRFDIGGNLYADRAWGDFRQVSCTPGGPTTTTKVKEPWSVSFALLGEWTPAVPLVLYGGPKLYYGASRIEAQTVPASGPATGWSRSIMTDSPVGGVLGMRFAVMGIDRLRLGLEMQFTARVSVGGTLGYAF